MWMDEMSWELCERVREKKRSETKEDEGQTERKARSRSAKTRWEKFPGCWLSTIVLPLPDYRDASSEGTCSSWMHGHMFNVSVLRQHRTFHHYKDYIKAMFIWVRSTEELYGASASFSDLLETVHGSVARLLFCGCVTHLYLYQPEGSFVQIVPLKSVSSYLDDVQCGCVYGDRILEIYFSRANLMAEYNLDTWI